ncbi:hypothetical protein SynMINOS11_02723 [Synechococcus sp. Minos11]|nr:hypothetical protein SynMINOS11_02723 [Synechococcus sp. Minos11]
MGKSLAFPLDPQAVEKRPLWGAHFFPGFYTAGEPPFSRQFFGWIA